GESRQGDGCHQRIRHQDGQCVYEGAGESGLGGNPKSESPKAERTPKTKKAADAPFRISVFSRTSAFGFRPSGNSVSEMERVTAPPPQSVRRFSASTLRQSARH